MPAAISLINDNPMATIISLNNDAQVVHLPLIYDLQTQRFYGHSANNNMLINSLIEPAKAKLNNPKHQLKLVFTGAHTYVSPTWHQQIKVPTWDYAVVHVSGKLKQVDEQQKQSILAKQISAFESNWQLNDVNEKLKVSMLNAITVFEISADVWQAKFKLSQHKSADAQASILQQMNRTQRKDMATIYQNHWR